MPRFPPPARARRSRAGCGHAEAVSLYCVRYGCTEIRSCDSDRVRLFRDGTKKQVKKKSVPALVSYEVQGVASYELVNHTSTAVTLLFSYDPFARGPGVQGSNPSPCTAVLLRISLGSPYYGWSKVSIHISHLESSLSSL